MTKLSQAIKEALEWEKKARDTYLEWSKMVEDGPVKKFLENLSNMEDTHVQILTTIKNIEDMDVSVLRHSWMDVSSGIRKTPSSSDKYLKEVFEFAMEKELQAHERYLQLTNQIDEAEIKELFHRMATEEKNHHELIRQQYNTLFGQLM